jgi:PTS system nitrogen regulatory IIA component
MVDISEKSVLLEIRARNKDGVLQELAAAVHRECPQADFETICRLLRERENIGTTGVGNGVAIPHARVNHLDHIHLGFGRSHEGIGFEAVDNQPVHCIVMILFPADKPDDYLRTLGSVSRSLKKPDIRRQLRAAETRTGIVKILRDFH